MYWGTMLVLFASGCSFFIPPTILYKNELIPRPSQGEAEQYIAGEDGAAVYAIEGLRVKVEPMTDDQLNALLPEDSSKGVFSTNPYTYGNWIDPLLGYRPKRFTVFRVAVINDIYAKVLLDPIKALLYTDQGEVLHSYGLPSFSPHKSFERYYRAIRGQSGNEFYRFDLRMGNARSTAYIENQKVFKGEKYSGLIAFDPLNEEVRQVRLVLKDFVLKFDASEQPLETVDIALEFEQKIATEQVRQAEATDR